MQNIGYTYAGEADFQQFITASQADYWTFIAYNVDSSSNQYVSPGELNSESQAKPMYNGHADKVPLGWECHVVGAPRAPPPAPKTPPSPPDPPHPPPSPMPPPPAPPPYPPPPITCSNECINEAGISELGWVSDGVCDDGGPGSEYSECAYGSDCEDCTWRLAPSPPPSAPPSPPPPMPNPPPALPKPSPPFPPSPPSPPSAPPALESQPLEVYLSGTNGTATCAPGAQCFFSYSLSHTPLLVSTSPSHGKEGDTLSFTGHGLSLVPSENLVSVGGRPCPVVSAQLSSTYTNPPCPVISCTGFFEQLVELTCTLPYQDSVFPHEITVSIAGKGSAPALDGAKITYKPIARSISPTSGSVAGGTRLTVSGDGFSPRKADVDVTIGNGGRCRITSVSASQIVCVTAAAADVSTSSTSKVKVKVRGVVADDLFDYTFDTSKTAVLTGAAWLTQGTNAWTLQVDGNGLSGNSSVFVGPTPCTITSISDTQIECTTDPPFQGSQAVTLTNDIGAAMGGVGDTNKRWPRVDGTTLSVSSISHTEVSLAGGLALTIGGAGFSYTDTEVNVCNSSCSVSAISAAAVTCTVPSTLIHGDALEKLNLTANITGEKEYIIYDVPSPPPPSADLVTLGAAYHSINTRGRDVASTLLIKEDRVVGLQFFGLNDTNLPRGATLSKLSLWVHPQSGGDGSVHCEVRASLFCGEGDEPLSDTSLMAFNDTNATWTNKSFIEWDIQPYEVTSSVRLQYDESPDLKSLIVDKLAQRTSLVGCSIALVLYAREVISASGDEHIQATKSSGWRAFHNSLDPAQAPELRIRYYPPTPAQQVAWTPDLHCPVVASVPGTQSAESEGTCAEPKDHIVFKPVEDTNGCAHLQLVATAATLDYLIDPNPDNNIGAAALPSPPPPKPPPPPAICTSGVLSEEWEALEGCKEKVMSPPAPPQDTKMSSLLPTDAPPPDWVLINKAINCKLEVNGVDLMEGCGLNKVVVGRDAMCAAVLDPPNAPRAACFDTKVVGEGIEQFTSWVDELREGVTVMVTSCSRLSFPSARPRLADALKTIGALDPPVNIDDAYTLVGVKGASAPIAENRLPCCTANVIVRVAASVPHSSCSTSSNLTCFHCSWPTRSYLASRRAQTARRLRVCAYSAVRRQPPQQATCRAACLQTTEQSTTRWGCHRLSGRTQHLSRNGAPLPLLTPSQPSVTPRPLMA